MGFRKTSLGASEIFCDGCGEICIVCGPVIVALNLDDEREWVKPAEWEPSEVDRKAGLKFGVRLRPGGSDPRWSKQSTVKLKVRSDGAPETVEVREWAWLCGPECAEKLQPPWERRDLRNWKMTGPGEPAGQVPTDEVFAEACRRRVAERRKPIT